MTFVEQIVLTMSLPNVNACTVPIMACFAGSVAGSGSVPSGGASIYQLIGAAQFMNVFGKMLDGDGPGTVNVTSLRRATKKTKVRFHLTTKSKCNATHFSIHFNFTPSMSQHIRISDICLMSRWMVELMQATKVRGRPRRQAHFLTHFNGLIYGSITCLSFSMTLVVQSISR